MSKRTLKLNKYELSSLIFLLFARLFAMYAIPLNDSTEARYAEMARKMMTLGDWITPWHFPGIPFWGKPPLSMWLAALSMKIFGVSAFVARLPSLFLSLLVLFLIIQLINTYRGPLQARVCLFVLSASFIFYLAAGTVMTDPALLFAITLCQISYWHISCNKTKNKKQYAYLFFLGLAIGLLAKGPIVLILVGGSIGIWVLWQKQWHTFFYTLPWISGGLLVLMLVLPWYILAEYKTPGFLNYFLVGEHFARFFQSAWQGDKYGFAHAHPFGTIWLYMLLNTFPWSLLIGYCLWKMRLKTNFIELFWKKNDDWIKYWLICLLFPLVFFSFAKNLIYPYTLPSIPAFAILFSELWVKYQAHQLKLIASAASWVGFIFISATLLFLYKPSLVAKSENRMASLWQTCPDHNQNPLIYWQHTLSFSSFFYTQGQLQKIDDVPTLCRLINPQAPLYLVVSQPLLPTLQKSLHQPLKKIGQIQTRQMIDVLVKVEHVEC